MAGLRITRDHEWIRVEGDEGTIGVTDYAQEQLGDIVFVELGAAGRAVAAGDEVAVVESVKAASEIYAPVGGEIVAVNGALDERPELVNSDPLGQGWLLKLAISDAGDLDSLMTEEEYAAFIVDQG